MTENDEGEVFILVYFLVDGHCDSCHGFRD